MKFKETELAFIYGVLVWDVAALPVAAVVRQLGMLTMA